MSESGEEQRFLLRLPLGPEDEGEGGCGEEPHQEGPHGNRHGTTHCHRAAEKPVPWNEGHCDLLSTRHLSQLSQRVGRPRECAVPGRQSRPSAFSRLTIVFSAMVTPDRSTGVFAWGSVNIARTWEPGSSSQKNGLLCSAGKVRTRGSVWGSLAAAGAPAAVWAITTVAPMRTMASVVISLETLIMALPLLRRSFMVLYRPVLILRPGRAGSRGV